MNGKVRVLYLFFSTIDPDAQHSQLRDVQDRRQDNVL
jgi:hypothetical protein